MERKYLSEKELLTLTDDRRLCYVSGAILEEGRQVGYMVRQTPLFPDDSGWRFFAGGEAGSRLRSGASGFYPLNTLCNYDRQVLPLLDALVGAAFVRTGAALAPLDSLDSPDSTAPAGSPNSIDPPHVSDILPTISQEKAGSETVSALLRKKIRRLPKNSRAGNLDITPPLRVRPKQVSGRIKTHKG
ncbi:MAG: DUF2185 domain-containing protein [Clostridiales bacterium]|nr:DUF2185 domain-containing protein [Clostridiales bacterium]